MRLRQGRLSCYFSEFKKRTQTEAIGEKKEDNEEECKRADESKNGTDDIEESKKVMNF